MFPSIPAGASMLEPTFYNITEHNFNCGFFNYCEQFTSSQDFENKFVNNPSVIRHDNVSSTIVEYIKECEQRIDTRCYETTMSRLVRLFLSDESRTPDIHRTYCISKPYKHCNTRTSGKTFEGPKVIVSEQPDNIKRIVIGCLSLAVLYNLGKRVLRKVNESFPSLRYTIGHFFFFK